MPKIGKPMSEKIPPTPVTSKQKTKEIGGTKQPGKGPIAGAAKKKGKVTKITGQMKDKCK